MNQLWSESLRCPFSAFERPWKRFARPRKLRQPRAVLAEKAAAVDSKALSRTVTKLAAQATPEAIIRAKAIVAEPQNFEALDRLALEMLASRAAMCGDAVFGCDIVESMFAAGLRPNVKAWSAVLSRLAKSPGHLERCISLLHIACAETPPKFAEETDILLKVGEEARISRKFRNGSFGSGEETKVLPKFGDGGAETDAAKTKFGVADETCSRPDAGAFNAVLNGCAVAGSIGSARRVLELMRSLGVKPDALTFNVLIKLYAKIERRDLVLRALPEMLRRGIAPCTTTFNSLLAALVGLGDLRRAEALIQALQHGRRDICSALAENGENLPELPRSYKPTAQMYTVLMKGYMNNGNLQNVVQTLRAMQDEERLENRPDEVTFTTVISALIREGFMDEARSVLREMAACNVPADLVTYNVLLSGYCRNLQIDRAKDLLSEMKAMKLGPNVVSYNTIINGCIDVNDYNGALDYFNEMRTAGIFPSHVSYTTLMKAFARNAQPKVAEDLFREMLGNERVKTDVVAWNMLIQSYCEAGMMRDSKRVFLEMKEAGLSPTVATYGSLVNGFVKLRKAGEVLLLWNEIQARAMPENNDEKAQKLEALQPDEALLDSICVYFVKTALFTKALRVIACMEKYNFPPKKTKYKRLFVELHSMIFTSKHKSEARRQRRYRRKMAAEAFKFWLGLPNTYYEY